MGRIRFALLCGLVLGLLGALVAYSRVDAVERGEAWIYDWNVAAAAETDAPPSDVVFVEIRDSDLQLVQENIGLSWPWPRELYTEIVRYVHSGKPRALAFDIIYEDRGAAVLELMRFADALREDVTVLAASTSERRYVPRAPIAEGAELAVLASFPNREAGLRAAVRVTSWGTRAFLRNNTLYFVAIAGTEEPLAETWVRLAKTEELADLFVGRSLTTAEADAETIAAEVKPEQIVMERFARPMPKGSKYRPRVLIPPTDVLAEAARGIGVVGQQNLRDGIMRRHAFFVRIGDSLLPSLSMGVFLAAFPERKVDFQAGQLRVNGVEIPTDDAGSTLLRYRSRARFESVGSYDLFTSIASLAEGEAPRVPASFFKDKIVIVSPTAKALQDFQATPVAKLHPGAQINAEAVDNLIRGEFVRRVSPATDAAFTLLVAFLVAVLVMAISRRFRQHWWGGAVAAVAAMGVMLGCLMLGRFSYSWAHTWVATFVPLGTAAFAAIAGLVFAALFERGDRRFVQEALGRYTSKALVDELLAHPEKLSLQFGETRAVSVFFSDIAGFTSISEGISPEKLVALLNDYLTAMTEIVLAHNGVVDKYIGDAIMAFWGAPFDDENHQKNAVSAALQMKQTCDALRATWQAKYGHEVFVRAGVNSGTAVAGNMGSTHKYNYTVMGDMVNLASRLEGANKAYGTELMVSEATFRAVEDAFVGRELDSIFVKGKNEPARVFEILARKDADAGETFAFIEPFERGLAAYRSSDFAGAKDIFEEIVATSGTDGPSLAFIERCEYFMHTPPGEQWDGVWRMKEK